MKLKIVSNLTEKHEQLIQKVIGVAIEVHRHLGPGFIESIYERALYHELQLQGIPFEKQVDILVPYKDTSIPGQRLDLIIDEFLILELKAVEEIKPIHEAQLLSYLKSTGLKIGLIINFKVNQLKSGIKRIVL
jgi:GxxExxY protein